MFDLSELPRPIIRYAAGLWRRRWLVAGVAWALTFAGWFGVWLLPDKYESRAQVFVQTETILEPVMTGVTARPNYEQRVEVMRQQLLTRPNVEEIVYRAGLDKGVRAGSEIERRAKLEKLIDWVASEIRIESPQDLYFVISYRFGEPHMARNVVDAVLNLLIEQDLGASLAEKEEARRRLDAEIARVDAQLNDKEREIAEFRRSHASELAVNDGNARERDRLEGDLARVADQLLHQQSRLAALESQLATTPRVSAGPELDQLKVQLAQLRSQYQESYPDIQNLKARIAELENVNSGALPANQEYIRIRNEHNAAAEHVSALRARERQIRAELETLAVAAGEAPGVGAELQRILRDHEQMQKGYEELVLRRDRLTLTANLGAGGRGVEYRVFERPTAALSPVAPPRLLLILAAPVLALGAGVALALLLTHLDRSFSQTADLRDSFGLPVLGSISAVPTDTSRAFQRKDNLRLAAACAGLAVMAAGYVYAAVLKLPADAGEQAAASEESGQWG